jgi:hypothetical protein
MIRFGSSGALSREEIHRQSRTYVETPALFAGSNIMPLIVFLHSQRSEYRLTHLEAHKFQVVDDDVENPVSRFQNIANSQ